MHRFRHLLLTTSALVPLGMMPASANPQGAQVVGGTVTVQGQGTAAVTVRQSTDRAIINWQTFNIGQGESTRFIQPSASSVALNRVIGGLGPSQIFGTLSANGRVFLVNPDGILFGPNSRIDTAGFLATTNNIKDADFMAGRYSFTLPGRLDASIVNQGTITAQTGGFAALVAPGVRNSGTITAKLGKIGLASGNGFSLDFYGDRLITLGLGDAIAGQVKDVVTGQTLDALVKNDGKLKANGGRVELTAVAARTIVDAVINNKGRIEANTIGRQSGMIVLGAATVQSKPAGASTQTVKVSGTLSVVGKKKGTKGGTIQVTGEDIRLAGATLDASGRVGGGKVLIGGDVGGGHGNPAVASIPQVKLEAGSVPTATSVSVDSSTMINASAVSIGNGGKVVVWADGATTFAGSIRATGGAISGNGGFVEASGYRALSFDGMVDTTAAKGSTGTLLLDPRNVTISSSPTSNGTGAFTPNGDDSNLNVSSLITTLAASNVFIQTGNTGSQAGNITVASPISWSSARTLTLNANNNIAINAEVTGTNGGLTLNAGGTISAAAAVAIGTFKLQAGSWSQIATSLPVFSAADFQISGGSFLRAVAGDGSGSSPYQLADVYGLQGIGSSGLLNKNFVLANNIDAIGTANWNSSAGFVPIGSAGAPFSGSLDGQTHAVDQLSINSTATNVGLFGYVGSTGSVRKFGLTNTSISGGDASFVGGVAGHNAGTISQVYVSGFVSGGLASTVGGLVGQNTGTISQSYSTAAASSGALGVAGGLVGENVGGTITQSYATGTLLGGISPALIASVGTQSKTESVFVSGHYVYVADYGEGFAIFDITNPNNPILVSRDTSSANPSLSVIVAGNYAYVGVIGGLNIFDVSNPSTPVRIGTYTTSDFVYGLATRGNHLFLTNYNTGLLKILDITNPGAPTLAATYSTGPLGNPYAISISGRYAYIGDQGNSAIYILDVSSPASPVLAGTYSVNGGAPSSISLSGNYAYVADSGKGFYVLNVSNPASPSLVGSYNPSGVYLGAQVSGKYAYLGGSPDGLTVLNISDPARPNLAGSLSGVGQGFGIAVSGSHAYIGADTNGLRVVDISTSGSTLGGLAGANTGGSVTNSYWNTQTSGQTTSAVGTGRTTAQLTSMLPVGFDSSVWAIRSDVNTGYPYLPGQFAPLPISVTADNFSKVYGNTDPALTYQITSGSLSGSDSFSGALMRASGENVGTYAIGIGSLTLPSSYALTFLGGNLTVTTRPITVTADAKSKTYGNADPTLTYNLTAGSLVGTDAFSGALSRNAGENVGAYSIIKGALDAGSNYALTYAGANLTVAARPLTITADAKSKTYGDANPNLTYAVSGAGLVGGDALTGSLSTAAMATSAAGLYTIDQGSVAASSNYALTYAGANLTVSARPLTVTADAKSKTYGNADPTLTYNVTSGSLVGADVFSGALARNAGENIGSYAINKGSLDPGSNYALTYAGANLSVTPRSITLTADAKNKTYGDTNPILTYAVGGAGLVSGDTLAGSLATAATATSGVGTYAISQGSVAASSNYALTYTGANLTVTSRPVTVTADAKSKTYGGDDPALTYNLSSGSLVGADAFSGALVRASGENVGAYAIGKGSLALSANYSLTHTGANLSISPAPLVITADDSARAPGIANPAFTASYSGLVRGDGPGVVSGLALSTAATTASPEGTYTIVASGGSASNYSVTHKNGVLNVTSALLIPVSVAADSLSKIYGNDDPSFTYRITSGSLSGTDSFNGSLVRAAGQDVGSYPVTKGTLSLPPGYLLNFGGATFAINPRPITVAANAQTKTYGNSDPALTYNVSVGSLVGSDNFTGALTRNAGESVGTYALNQGSLGLSSNYALTYGSANLSVTPRSITVTADAKSKTYGDANPTLTYAVGGAGLVGGDVLSGSLTTTATATSGAGLYAINQGSLANSNYALTYTGANLAIDKRSIAITADTKSKTYGDAEQNLTYQVTSGTLVGTDAFSGSLARAAGENVGNYAINQGSVNLSSNYALTYGGSSFAITPAPLTIRADNQSRQAGAANPAFTASYSGFVRGDGASVVSGLMFSTPANIGASAATYSIIPSGANAANYTISYINGVLTVTPSVPNVTTTPTLPTGASAFPTQQITNLALPITTSTTQSKPSVVANLPQLDTQVRSGDQFVAGILGSFGVEKLTLPAVNKVLDTVLWGIGSKYLSSGDLNSVYGQIIAGLNKAFANTNFNVTAAGKLTPSALTKLESLGTDYLAGLVLSAAREAIVNQMRGKAPAIVVEETNYLLKIVEHSALATASLTRGGVPLPIAMRTGVAIGVVQAATSEVVETLAVVFEWRAYVAATDRKIEQINRAWAANQEAILEAKKLSDQTGDKTPYIELLKISENLSGLKSLLAKSASPLSTEGGFFEALRDSLWRP